MENKAHGNMYDWVKTWNPLGGECQHKCGYCSSQSFMRYPEFAKKYQGEPRIIEHELKNLGKGKTIFVVAQDDLFAKNVSREIILRILDHCKKYPENKYLFQSKNPHRFLGYWTLLPPQTILCTTIESNRWHSKMGNAPHPYDRAYAMSQITTIPKYLTLEPLMDFDLLMLIDLVKMVNPLQVNIGADSKKSHLDEPSKEKVHALIEALKGFTTIAKKSNLERLLK